MKKKFVLDIIIILSPMLLLLILVNLIIDPGKIFLDGYESQIAEILLDSHHVTNIQNYDERLLQEEIIEHRANSPEIITLGSSRTMLLNSNHFSSTKFFNHSVSGASMEDIIAIYQALKIKKQLPTRIIMGFDPWTLNSNNNQTRWRSISSYYYTFKGITNEQNFNVNQLHKIKELLSVSYFQASIEYLPNILKKQSNPIATTRKQNVLNTKLIDGSLVYGTDYRNATPDKINGKIRSYISGNVYSLENFDEVSQNIVEDLTHLIDDMQQNGIKVEFFLCPYPPLVYEYIEENFPAVLETEKIANNFASKYDIRIYGSFDPTKMEMDNTFFYDGMHCNEKGVRKILNSYNISD
jgi:hypothetical protein